MKSQKNNMWMKILSVVIAVLIWLFVANTNDPVVTKRFYSIPVKVRMRMHLQNGDTPMRFLTEKK